MKVTSFNHALQRIRREHRGCHRSGPCAGSLSWIVVLRSLAIISLLLFSGCTGAQTVSRAELEHLKTQRHEPKVSMWYYPGFPK